MRVLAAIVFASSFAGSASAQTPFYSGAVMGGSGLSFGDGQKSVIVQRSPIFLDASFRYWSSEEDWFVLGASGRVEIDGRTSLAAVPRIEYQLRVGPLALRPGVGVPFVIAPRTMFGVEGSFSARLELTGPLGLVAAIYADAYFLGSDVPDDSVVVMINGAIGVDIQL